MGGSQDASAVADNMLSQALRACSENKGHMSSARLYCAGAISNVAASFNIAGRAIDNVLTQSGDKLASHFRLPFRRQHHPQ